MRETNPSPVNLEFGEPNPSPDVTGFPEGG